MDTGIVFTFGLLWSVAVCIQAYAFFQFLRIGGGVCTWEWNSAFNSLRSYCLFSRVAALFYLPTSNRWRFQFFWILHKIYFLLFVYFFDDSCPNECEVWSLDFDLYFPKFWWCGASFHVLIGRFVCLWRNVYASPLPIFQWAVFLLLLSYKKSFWGVWLQARILRVTFQAWHEVLPRLCLVGSLGEKAVFPIPDLAHSQRMALFWRELRAKPRPPPPKLACISPFLAQATSIWWCPYWGLWLRHLSGTSENFLEALAEVFFSSLT